MDTRRRDAERAALHQADPRLLIERLRAGQLDPRKLALAVWLGDPAAREAAGGLDAAPPPDDLQAWTLGVPRWGRQAFVRVQSAALRAACREHTDLASRAAAEVLLDALDAWADDPQANRDALLDLLETQLAPNVGQTFAQRRNPSDWTIVGAVQVAARCVRHTWTAAALIPVDLPAGTEPERLTAIREHFADHGAVVEWVPAERGLDLRVLDCGRIGASGVSKALLPLVRLDPLDVIERLFPVRERSSPVLYAARKVGEQRVREAARTAVVPWALR